jgi:hypothetical protein
MATHDYVIDNQTAPNFRFDLNNALAAIVTQNSNATAPSVTYANMIWYDTANNLLRKRNEANSGWITLGTIDEGTGTFTPSGERALASQAQAEAGTDNATIMSPLRTKQALDAGRLGALVAVETADFSLAALTWVKRQVAESHNGIADASVSSNQVTLPAGTYVIQAWATCDQGTRDWLQVRLYNVTSAATEAASATQRVIDGDGDSGNITAHLTAVVTLTDSAVFELQSYITASNRSRPSDNYAEVNPQGAALLITRVA